MRQETGQLNSEAQKGGSSSFLVRMWREPQEKGSGPVRVYLRNLQTGEELYLGDPERVGEVLSLEAATVGREQQESSETKTAASAG